jgi:phage shock protein C
VCGGIAEYLNLDSTLVRIAFVIGVISSAGPLILAYFGLAFAMPKEEPLSPEERLSIIRNEIDDE